MKKHLFLIITLGICTCCFSQNIGLGKWRNHFSYDKLYKIVPTDGRIYGQAKYGLFYYDTEEQTMIKYSKTDGLSDVGISNMAYDSKTKCMLIAYNNSNIDLLINDVIYNISDIKRKEISGDKAIYNINFYNRKAYLACGFGIVVIDISRKEIADVYYLGENGTYLKINDIAFTPLNIVAATDSGMMYIDKQNQFPNISTNWTIDSTSAVGKQTVFQLKVFSDKLMATVRHTADSSTIYVGTTFSEFTPWISGNIKSVEAAENKLIISEYNKVCIYNSDLTTVAEVTNSNEDWFVMEAQHATLDHDNKLVIAHEWAGMIIFPDYKKKNTDNLRPSGPRTDDVYNLSGYGNGVILSPGSRRGDYFVEANVATFQNNEWTNLNGSMSKDTSWNVLDVVVDPANKKKMYAASWRNGVLEIENNTAINLYNENNTNNVLTAYTDGDYRSLRVGACAADAYKNVWFTNSLRENGLVVRRKDGTWEAINTYPTVTDEIYHLVIDSMYGYKWFYGQGNKIYVHDGDDRIAYIHPNNGSKLESSVVNCLVQDHTNELWIGTDKGIKVIYNMGNAFKNGGNGQMSAITCNNILYSEDGKVEYLLAYENVTAIAVDGANRKWIGTASGGVFLISENGLEQLAHFSEDNSPLPSNKITAIGIAPETGEVFIGTDNGLVSYRSTATYATSKPNSEIYAFPNPVHPDYNGDIAIKGFTRNALVHITDVAGKVVFSTQAHGGQAIWNGKNQHGERVATGVYYVFASDQYGKNQSVAKILFIK